MNTEFCIKTNILKSSHIDYKEGNIKKIYIQKKIGEGSYGLIFLIQNNHVMKIFKNSTVSNTNLTESNYLIPLKNENRELLFYFKYINDDNNINDNNNDNKTENNYIIKLYAIGVIKDQMIDNSNLLDINSYFVILPYCIPFYKKYNCIDKPLIYKKDGPEFVLKIVQRMLEASSYLEKNYNIINLDITLNNLMITKKDGAINDIIMLDFSIIKNNNNKKYNFNNRYYIWPNGNFEINILPSYSICINGLELLFGKKEILEELSNNQNKEKIINKYLIIIKNINKIIHNVFYQGLVKKIKTNNLLKIIYSL